MNYQTYQPHEDIEPIIKCYWTLEAPAESSPGRQRIVPDGCMELIFHLGDSYYQYLTSGDRILQPRSFVFGQILQSLEIEPSGYSNIIAARFQPDGFSPIATIDLEAMNDRAVPLTELFGEEGQNLETNVLNGRTLSDKIESIEAFLIERLQQPVAADRIASKCVDLLLHSSGQMKVDEVVKNMGINRRQLERKFSSEVGLSPKKLSRILRLQNTLQQLMEEKHESLTQLALDNGYFDQAHFIRDFKEFTGLNPARFYSNNLSLSKLFIEA